VVVVLEQRTALLVVLEIQMKFDIVVVDVAQVQL
jgi:hypothetical protein